MESCSSSICELPTNQRSVNNSIAPFMTSESNRPYFIAVCTEIICELDPLIIADLYDELQDELTLIDGYVNSHEVEFNKIPLMPILTQGNSVFQTQIFNGSTTTNEYPRYHRLTTSNLRDVTFEVDMPNKYPISSKLLSGEEEKERGKGSRMRGNTRSSHGDGESRNQLGLLDSARTDQPSTQVSESDRSIGSVEE
uniref:Uncharacterized protein n=1 Tax=Medicago truncatula TaxID=3880 RepID=A2Q6B1_MEDTR|nr:hypothetical protein MtrDRAFT_AC174467g19v1 [Medicago truncatula]